MRKAISRSVEDYCARRVREFDAAEAELDKAFLRKKKSTRASGSA